MNREDEGDTEEGSAGDEEGYSSKGVSPVVVVEGETGRVPTHMSKVGSEMPRGSAARRSQLIHSGDLIVRFFPTFRGRHRMVHRIACDNPLPALLQIYGRHQCCVGLKLFDSALGSLFPCLYIPTGISPLRTFDVKAHHRYSTASRTPWTGHRSC